MPTLTPNPTYEKRPIWEVVVNAAGTIAETLYPGNWLSLIGVDIPMVGSTSDNVKPTDDGNNFWRGLRSAQLHMTLTPDDIDANGPNYLPAVVAGIVTAIFMWRK